MDCTEINRPRYGIVNYGINLSDARSMEWTKKDICEEKI